MDARRTRGWDAQSRRQRRIALGVYCLCASVVYWLDWTGINLERRGERRRGPHDFSVMELPVRLLHVDERMQIQHLTDRPFEMQIDVYPI